MTISSKSEFIFLFILKIDNKKKYQMNSFIQSIVKNLNEELMDTNRKNIIDMYEEKLSRNFENLSNSESFFDLPINNILSIISKVNFSDIETNLPKLIEIIKKTISSHKNEKETLFLLDCIKVPNDAQSFSFNDCISIFQSFTNNNLCVTLGKLYAVEEQQPILDYEYQLNNKEKEIEILREQIELIPKNRRRRLRLIKSLPTVSDQLSHTQPIHIPPIAVATTPPSPRDPYLPLDFEPNIFKAIKDGKLSSVKYLIERKGVDKEGKDECENTPLHVACKEGYLDIVKYLVEEAHVDIETWNRNETPLHIACKEENLPVVQYLIEKAHADEEAEDKEKRTPLHFACASGHLPIVEYLIDKVGVDEDASDKCGKTPLLVACEEGHLQVVRYLVEKADVDIEETDYFDRTPLHIASCYGKTDVVIYLVTKGANKNALNKFGRTPLDVVCNGLWNYKKSQKDIITNYLRN